MRIYLIAGLIILSVTNSVGQRISHLQFTGYDYGKFNVFYQPDSFVYVAGKGYYYNRFLFTKLDRDNKSTFAKSITANTGNSDIYLAGAMTKDTGFVFTGTTRSGYCSGKNLYLTKTDRFGNHLWSAVLWEQDFNQNCLDIIINDIIEDADSNLVVTGSFNERFGFAKFNKHGKLIVSYIYFRNSDPYKSAGINIREVPGEGYAILGYKIANGGNFYPHLIMMNYYGNMVWNRSFDNSYTSQALAVTKDTGILIAVNNHAVIKYNLEGTVQWKKVFGGQNNKIDISKILPVNNGYLLTGSIESHYHGAGKKDALLMKLNLDGDLDWCRLYGLPDDEIATDIIAKDSGYLVAAASTSSDGSLLLIETDSLGFSTCHRTIPNEGFTISDEINTSFTTFNKPTSFGKHWYITSIVADEKKLTYLELCQNNKMRPVALVAPRNNTCADTAEYILELENNGKNDISKFALYYSINDTMNGGGCCWQTTFPSGTTRQFPVFPDLYLPPGKNKLKFWTAMPNEVPDEYIYDDTLAVELNFLESFSAKITITDKLTFCQGEKAVLKADTGAGLTYKWLKDGNVLNVKQSSLSAVESGSYQVFITNKLGCESKSNIIEVLVHPRPEIPQITQNGNLLTSSAENGNQWYLNGNIITGATSQTYKITEDGNYRVIVSNSQGCSTPSGQFYFETVGIYEPAETMLNIYPNPANEVFFADGIYGMTYSLTDLSGKVLLKGKYENGIYVKELSGGVYILRINGQDKVYRAKIILAK